MDLTWTNLDPSLTIFKVARIQMEKDVDFHLHIRGLNTISVLQLQIMEFLGVTPQLHGEIVLRLAVVKLIFKNNFEFCISLRMPNY